MGSGRKKRETTATSSVMQFFLSNLRKVDEVAEKMKEELRIRTWRKPRSVVLFEFLNTAFDAEPLVQTAAVEVLNKLKNVCFFPMITAYFYCLSFVRQFEFEAGCKRQHTFQSILWVETRRLFCTPTSYDKQRRLRFLRRLNERKIFHFMDGLLFAHINSFLLPYGKKPDSEIVPLLFEIVKFEKEFGKNWFRSKAKRNNIVQRWESYSVFLRHKVTNLIANDPSNETWLTIGQFLGLSLWGSCLSPQNRVDEFESYDQSDNAEALFTPTMRTFSDATSIASTYSGEASLAPTARTYSDLQNIGQERQQSQASNSCRPALIEFNLTGEIAAINFDGEPEEAVSALKNLPYETFSKHVESILDKICEKLDSENSLNAVFWTCIALVEARCVSGKSFLDELQERCSKIFTSSYRAGFESLFSRLHQEVDSGVMFPELTGVASSIEKAKHLFRKKSFHCPRLIGKLYGLGHLSLGFFIPFLQLCFETKDENVYRGLLEMFSESGRQIFEFASSQQDSRKTLEKIVFGILAEAHRQASCPENIKLIIGEILSLKMNKWPIVDEKYSAARNLRLMLSPLTPELAAKNPHKFSDTINEVRDFLSTSSPEMCQSLYDVFLAKLKDYALPQPGPSFILSQPSTPSSVVAPNLLSVEQPSPSQPCSQCQIKQEMPSQSPIIDLTSPPSPPSRKRKGPWHFVAFNEKKPSFG